MIFRLLALGALITSFFLLLWTNNDRPHDYSASPLGRARGCVVLDISASTRSERPSYLSALEMFAADRARDGAQSICVVLANRDPLANEVLFADLTRSDKNAFLRDREAAATARSLRLRVEDLIRHTRSDEASGSSLIASMVAASRALDEQGELLVLSDGVEQSDIAQFSRGSLSPAAQKDLVQKLRRGGLIAPLKGVKVHMPFFGVGSHLTPARNVAVARFWDAYVAAGGASIDIGRPVHSASQ